MKNQLKFPAKYICHWAAGSTPCCERHANGFQTLARHMCCNATLTDVTEPTECAHCVNEANATKENKRLATSMESK